MARNSLYRVNTHACAVCLSSRVRSSIATPFLKPLVRSRSLFQRISQTKHPAINLDGRRLHRMGGQLRAGGHDLHRANYRTPHGITRIQQTFELEPASILWVQSLSNSSSHCRWHVTMQFEIKKTVNYKSQVYSSLHQHKGKSHQWDNHFCVCV